MTATPQASMEMRNAGLLRFAARGSQDETLALYAPRDGVS